MRLFAATVFGLQIVLLLVSPAHCGTTGIITGTVTDASSGQKLAGVNVVVAGTGLTTVTDAKGYYVITNVSPGDQKVTASLVGYSDESVEKVSVLMDVTSTVDLAMTQGIVEEEQVVVKEARPMVQKDVVPTMYTIDRKQEEMVRSDPNLLYQVPGLVKTLPGVVEDSNSTPHIRGGRADEIGWMMDGVPILDPVSNGFGTNLVTIGLDKLELYTGGYRAEYGNAVSGVMNEIVKTGRTSPGAYLQTLGGQDSFQGILPEIGGYSDKGWDYYAGAYLWSSDLREVIWNHVKSADEIGKFNYKLDSKNKLTLLTAQGSAEYLMPSSHTQTFSDGQLVDVSRTTDQQHQSYGLAALTL
ncbi:MAG TPA: carboxypeptidase regulatory-like domain-containing protein, partial [Armatimonadota bacterium]